MIGYSVTDMLNLPHVQIQNLIQLKRRSIRSISTDSRSIHSDEVFIALRGETHEGHDYIKDVLKRKPLACTVDTNWYEKHKHEYARASFFVVENTLTALGDIARSYRRKHDIPIIGITGSNGKTSTKEMVAAILKTKYPVLYTTGNYNNHIGLPLTLLRMTPRHKVAVLEMGTNQPGDIEYLCSIAQQSHGLITNIGNAHIELLRNRRGIAKEKSAIYKTLPAYGVAFINDDEPLLRNVVMDMTKKIFFGSQPDSDIELYSVLLDQNGKATIQVRANRFTKKTIECSLNVVGKHAAYNALAALAVGFVFHCPTSKMIDAVKKYHTFNKRMEVKTPHGVMVIDDTYNANPDSVIAAIDTFESMKIRGKKIAVFADMLELGAASIEEHSRIGRLLKKSSIKQVYTFGNDAKYISEYAVSSSTTAQHFTQKENLFLMLQKNVLQGDAVLVKGSRAMRMEEVVSYLHSLFETKETQKK